jgi:hypothetical protein
MDAQGNGGDDEDEDDDYDPLPSHVVLDIDMNGHKGEGQLITHKLPVQRSPTSTSTSSGSTADFYNLVATRFCKGDLWWWLVIVVVDGDRMVVWV